MAKESTKPAWIIAVEAANDGATPRWHDNVPWCQEECRHHDGKRCALIGFRPGSICEPVVADIVQRVDRLESDASTPTPEARDGG